MLAKVSNPAKGEHKTQSPLLLVKASKFKPYHHAGFIPASSYVNLREELSRRRRNTLKQVQGGMTMSV